ncbi:uncharacterized protein LOC127790430 [Diospyros lotus]|uniref:uncharacterized protein LOC127790430 n=1 Tax=Diospyros lotus TaxID=55363 RepID=UPI002251C275|nr:uncharacterized protein LOC127790430 [Diospyros lotus]
MSLSSFFCSLHHRLTSRRPLLLHAVTWTAILGSTVAVASFSPEVTFVSAVSPASAFSRSCEGRGLVRLPLDDPAEVLCFPAHMLRRSRVDLVVPPVYAALVVAGSLCAVRALGLWEMDNDDRL